MISRDADPVVPDLKINVLNPLNNLRRGEDPYLRGGFMRRDDRFDRVNEEILQDVLQDKAG